MKKKEKSMYFHMNGTWKKMENCDNGNYIIREVYLVSGINTFHFCDAHNTRESRIGYNGNKKICTIHKFPLSYDENANVQINMKNAKFYDIMLIKNKKHLFDVQVRFNKY